MTAIWGRSNQGWSVLEPTGFPDEAALHQLVEEAPQVLPLSGSPQLAILAREFVVGTGSADLIAVEPSGRVSIIEVKLAKNAEARRAVVAQILGYAAFLKGTTRETFERRLAPHLAGRGWSSIVDAVEQVLQSPLSDVSGFERALEASLATGQFRLVLVLDSAPPELVRLTGYLESIAPDLTIDLVTVSRYEVDGSPALVPQRVDPGRIEASDMAESTSSPSAYVRDSGGLFEELAAERAPEKFPRAARLLVWARDLESKGLTVLWSRQGSDYITLIPRAIGHDAGLVTVVSDGSLWTWRSVFSKRAPASLAAIEAMLGGPMKHGGTVPDPSDDLLAAIGEAYAEAASRVK